MEYIRSGEENNLIGYIDSDLASDVNDRHNIVSIVFYLNKNLVTWASQIQKNTAFHLVKLNLWQLQVYKCHISRSLDTKTTWRVNGRRINQRVLYVDKKISFGADEEHVILQEKQAYSHNIPFHI